MNKEITNYSNFWKILIDYFKYYWDQHQFDIETTTGYERKEVFHGMVLYTDYDNRNIIEKSIKTRFYYAGMKLNLSGFIQDNIHNRAGEFTFYNMNSKKYKHLDELFRNRIYDIIIISEEIEYDKDLLAMLLNFIKDNNAGIVIFLTNFKSLSPNNKPIDLV